MRRLARRKTPTEELKEAALRALVNALDEDRRAPEPEKKGGLRAVAVGAVIYTAGRAVFKRQRFLREHLPSVTERDRAEDAEDEEETRADEEPEREPVRRAARRKGAQPSLKLPSQRRPRIRMSQD